MWNYFRKDKVLLMFLRIVASFLSKQKANLIRNIILTLNSLA